MKYLILSLSLVSFLFSSSLFVKEFNIADIKAEFEHASLFQDVGNSFTHKPKETIVCYRQTHRNFYLLILTFSVSSLGFIYYAFDKKRELSKKLTITNEEITIQNEIINEKNNEIISGINYAKHLQRAMLSSTNILKEYFKEYLIINKPKDIVSGDFYWVEKKDDYIFIAVADCTGHGVPGAFMTILGNSLLYQIVIENNIISTSDILQELNKKLYKTFENENVNNKVNDGMDISIIRFECKTKEILFSGAKRNLLIINNNELLEFKGSKLSLGASFNQIHPFGEEKIKVNTGEFLFMYSDGVTDQMGGENNRKFSSKAFKELLFSIKNMNLLDQRIFLKDTISKWRDTNTQTDDILILGLEI